MYEVDILRETGKQSRQLFRKRDKITLAKTYSWGFL